MAYIRRGLLWTNLREQFRVGGKKSDGLWPSNSVCTQICLAAVAIFVIRQTLSNGIEFGVAIAYSHCVIPFPRFDSLYTRLDNEIRR